MASSVWLGRQATARLWAEYPRSVARIARLPVLNAAPMDTDLFCKRDLCERHPRAQRKQLLAECISALTIYAM
jgi:hypothetical protein